MSHLKEWLSVAIFNSSAKNSLIMAWLFPRYASEWTQELRKHMYHSQTYPGIADAIASHKFQGLSRRPESYHSASGAIRSKGQSAICSKNSVCAVKLREGINVDLIRCRMTFDEIFVRSHGAFFRLRSHNAFYPQFTLQWTGRPQ